MAKELPISSYTGRVGYSSKKQLNLVDSAIKKIEDSNFIVRYFNKHSLEILKKQKKYIKTMWNKEKDFVVYKKLQGNTTKLEIIKANEALEKQLKAGENIRYVSKKEENHKKVRKVRSDKGGTHNYKKRILKSEKLKPRRLFYD